jgi:hypothetical protein
MFARISERFLQMRIREIRDVSGQEPQVRPEADEVLDAEAGEAERDHAGNLRDAIVIHEAVGHEPGAQQVDPKRSHGQT